MKKRHGRILAVMLACTMAVLPVSDVMAATTYDVSGQEVSQILFPGDSMMGISVPVMMGDIAEDTADGTWTNTEDTRVYRAKTVEDGSISLETVGYTLKVVQGTAKQKKSEEDKEKKHHYQYTEEDQPEVPADLAFYEEGAKIVLTADEPAEGMEFAGWSVESGDVTLEDTSSVQIVIEMPVGGAVIAAQYREKQPERYAVTVNSGTDLTGGGSYAAGSTVEIQAADRSGENLEFAGWSVDTGNAGVTDAGSAVTSFTMPEGEVIVTATYRQIETEPAKYAVTVNSGTDLTGSGSYAAGSTVEIQAADRSGENLEFAGWSVDTGNAAVTDAGSAVTSFTMPEGEVVVTATYRQIETEPAKYAVTVNSGTDLTGGGSYAAGSTVEIQAADRSGENLEFAGWSVDTGNAGLTDAGSAVTSFTMPEGEVIVTATYRQIETEPAKYAVTVNSGTDLTGGGSYAAGSTVEIQAADRSGENLEFTGWSVDTGNAGLTDAGSAVTSFTMPEGEVIVTATYQQIETEPATPEETPTEAQTEPKTEIQTEMPTEAPEQEDQKYELTVEYGSDSGEYAEGEQITITADDRSDEGMEFAGWFVESMNVQLDTNIETTASFAMPAEDVVIAATYEEAEPVTEAGQSESVPSATEADQSESTVPLTEAGEGENVVPATEAGQSESTAPATEAGQSESTAPATEAGQSESTAPATEAGQSESTAPATEAGQSENTNPVVLPDNQETDPEDQTQPNIVLYTVTVENGAGSGEYAAGDVVTIEAGEPEGKIFTGWTSEDLAIVFENAFGQITSFVMPEGDVTVRADFAAAQFEMTLDDGNGDQVTETKEQGAEIRIKAADRTAENLEFDHWTGTALIAGIETELEFEDAESASTSFLMPGGPVTVTAVYTEIITLHHVTVANGTINGSQTETDCEDGAEITVTADPSEAGQAFSCWEVNEGEIDLGDDAYISEIQVTVDQDMDFKAIYEGIEYNVKVNSGTANYETCTLGTKVKIRADEAPEGMEFDTWYVDSENTALADAGSSTTTFIMPEGDVTVSAKYRKIQYQVSVENGKSDAQYYYAGDQVTITSDYPAGGREFGEWKAVSGNVKFADSTRWKTTFTMPASNVVVKAVYKDGPSANDNLIQDLENGGAYYIDDPIKFTASGAGMTNLTPNPGDYRYRPASYQIANVTGTWQGSPYTTTMAIKATGEYTLKVIFNKDVFDGNAWVSDGTVDTKSVTFKIVTKAAGVATGDTTPIMLVITVMVVSCIIFIILLILFLKKRKR